MAPPLETASVAVTTGDGVRRYVAVTSAADRESAEAETGGEARETLLATSVAELRKELDAADEQVPS